MSSKSRIEPRRTVLGALVALGAALGGCSDIYYDRRETIALGADDHLATNEVLQMVDPWPRYVGNKNIAFNGQRMQAAVECYRYDKVTPPVNAATSSIAQQRDQRQASGECPARNLAPAQGAPAAPVAGPGAYK
jgi:hypothetical protein